MSREEELQSLLVQVAKLQVSWVQHGQRSSTGRQQPDHVICHARNTGCTETGHHRQVSMHLQRHSVLDTYALDRRNILMKQQTTAICKVANCSQLGVIKALMIINEAYAWSLQGCTEN